MLSRLAALLRDWPGVARSGLVVMLSMLTRVPASAADAQHFYAEKRAQMADTQIAARGIRDPRVLDAMRKDWKGSARTVLRVDGGMVASDWTMQRLADILDAPVDRPTILETTALGAAWLAGSKAGVWPDMADFARSWALDRRFEPAMDARTRTAKLKGWHEAVRRTLSHR